MGPNGRMSGPPPPGRFYPDPQGGRPQSPVGPPYQGPPRAPYPGRSMSPAAAFPPVPRSMSPGPRSMSPVPRSMSPGPGARPGPGPRSMSPGPYGPGGMQRPMMPVNQRQRSNSAGNISPPTVGGVAPPKSSPLVAAEAPGPAPTSDLPALPPSAPTSPTGSQINRKAVSTQDA